VSPVDGASRPRKPDGKPLGFRSGRLARKLRFGRLKRGRNRAEVTILLPRGQPSDDFRKLFVENQGDILVTEGDAKRVLDRATREFLREVPK
jgi:hypothetical protein